MSDDDDDSEEENDMGVVHTVPMHCAVFHAYMDARIKNDWIPMIEALPIANGRKAVFYESGSVIKLENV